MNAKRNQFLIQIAGTMGGLGLLGSCVWSIQCLHVRHVRKLKKIPENMLFAQVAQDHHKDFHAIACRRRNITTDEIIKAWLGSPAFRIEHTISRFWYSLPINGGLKKGDQFLRWTVIESNQTEDFQEILCSYKIGDYCNGYTYFRCQNYTLYFGQSICTASKKYEWIINQKIFSFLHEIYATSLTRSIRETLHQNIEIATDGKCCLSCVEKEE